MPLRPITIEGEADPEKVTICHCTDCQTGTGSAFRVSVPVPGSTFKMTGQPTNYLKTTADSGNPRVQAFCPKCGSPIYSTTPGEGQQASYMVRVGILRQRDQLHAEAAELVPLGAALGHRPRCASPRTRSRRELTASWRAVIASDARERASSPTCALIRPNQMPAADPRVARYRALLRMTAE